MFLSSILVCFESSNLLRIHMLCDLICLPLLERKPEPFVAVILVVGLIFVVLDTNEVTVDSLGIQGEGDESVDRGSLGNDFKGPRLMAVNIICSAIGW